MSVQSPHASPHAALHDELALLVKAGLTPMQALQAATRNAAELTGRLRDIGTVERGKIADLVLLESDPLADITNSRRVSTVILGGRIVATVQPSGGTEPSMRKRIHP